MVCLVPLIHSIFLSTFVPNPLPPCLDISVVFGREVTAVLGRTRHTEREICWLTGWYLVVGG